MKKSRHSEEKIIAAVKQMEGGRKTAEVAREMGVSAATLYAWKSKYAGMQVSDARRLRQLEEENRRLKHISGGPEPGQRSDESGHRKKRMELVGARQDVAFVMEKFDLSER